MLLEKHNRWTMMINLAAPLLRPHGTHFGNHWSTGSIHCWFGSAHEICWQNEKYRKSPAKSFNWPQAHWFQPGSSIIIPSHFWFIVEKVLLVMIILYFYIFIFTSAKEVMWWVAFVRSFVRSLQLRSLPQGGEYIGMYWHEIYPNSYFERWNSDVTREKSPP